MNLWVNFDLKFDPILQGKMAKIVQNHLLCAFVADLKIDAIYALYPESFCHKNLAIRKVFAFCALFQQFSCSAKQQFSNKSEVYLYHIHSLH